MQSSGGASACSLDVAPLALREVLRLHFSERTEQPRCRRQPAWGGVREGESESEALRRSSPVNIVAKQRTIKQRL